jgi:saccharopine dehydrogenase-like NADP-dependent oxidoreductase
MPQRAAGITALVGIGSMPGLADLMNKLAFSLLDEVVDA